MLPRRRHGRVILYRLVLGVALAAASSPALAAKWRHCPTKVSYYPSHIGALTAPFAHPGHEVGIVLSFKEMAESGAFSTAPEGNTVSVTLASLWGEPITLPPITAAAVSPATLYFTFPDTRALLGRVLAGPAAIRVTTAGRTTADIEARHLVALPPATDVGALVAGGLPQAGLATMDARGAIWMPVQFSAFGTMQKPMSMCPGTFVPLTAFTVGASVRALPPALIGPNAGVPTYPPFRALRRIDVFLGDFLVDGTNYYGIPTGTIPVLRIPRGLGIRICGIDDAVDLVLRARGFRRWALPWSEFSSWMPGSKPLDIVLSNSSYQGLASVTPALVDAFGQECVLP